MQTILTDFLKDRVDGASQADSCRTVLPKVLSKVKAYKEAKRGGFSEMLRDQLEEINSMGNEDTLHQS
jgi:hypothetical protein